MMLPIRQFSVADRSEASRPTIVVATESLRPEDR